MNSPLIHKGDVTLVATDDGPAIAGARPIPLDVVAAPAVCFPGRDGLAGLPNLPAWRLRRIGHPSVEATMPHV
ncbi:MAG: hypothetical protein U1E62_15470 [Alsobacter sp.]